MRAPVESKVVAAGGGATAGTAVAGFVIYLLDVAFYGGWNAGDDVPEPVVLFVFFLVSAGLAFLAGYLAPHTQREFDA